MKNNWVFWGSWISVNTIASLIQGNIAIYPSIPSIIGMVLGILLYIVLYALVDKALLAHNHLQSHHALRKIVYIKVGLQLLNIALLLGLPISLELWAGSMSLHITDDLLGIQPTAQPFVYALLNTLLTGGFLSLIVAAMTVLVTLSGIGRAK